MQNADTIVEYSVAGLIYTILPFTIGQTRHTNTHTYRSLYSQCLGKLFSYLMQ